MEMNWKGWLLSGLLFGYLLLMGGIIFMQWHPPSATCVNCNPHTAWTGYGTCQRVPLINVQCPQCGIYGYDGSRPMPELFQWAAYLCSRQ